MTRRVRPWAPRTPLRGRQVVPRWYPGSLLHRFLLRLGPIDPINRGMHFAAVLLLGLVPFMIVVQSMVGRGTATRLTERFGLDDDAAAALSAVLMSPSSTSGGMTAFSAVVLVLGGISAARAVQELYERSFGVDRRGARDAPRHVLWLVALAASSVLTGWARPIVEELGGPVLTGVVTFVVVTAFWWFSMWWLLGGQESWRRLLPSALATGVCWLVLDVALRLRLSDALTSNYEQYGALGVVFSLMSLLIATGLTIILGAVFGIVWQERRGSGS
ncbi:MAG: hypothetical protein HGA44_13775 [Cellulomonadaceae bacterium]|nr:hypothetical protein [Cellulomonadaceae bacterium]